MSEIEVSDEREERMSWMFMVSSIGTGFCADMARDCLTKYRESSTTKVSRRASVSVVPPLRDDLEFADATVETD